MVQRLIRGQPPSPPHSTSGEIPSDISQGGDMYSMYDGTTAAPYGGSGQGSDVSFDEQSSLAISLQYAPTSNYSQSSSLHHPATTDDIRVNTPPADDSVTSGSLGSTSTRWPSPSLRQALSKPRVLRSPRQRRRAKNRKDTDLGINLSAPLSVLTKDMAHIPLKDMERHVNRSTEERLAEGLKKQGKIPRPMNSFMLYRSAYADRTKELFRQQNHQVVSAAAGYSWNNEDPEIKRKYEQYADTEKKNHLKAHPGYKFTPAKDKKKRSILDDERSYHGGYRSTPEGSPAQRHISRLSTFSSPEISSSGWDSGHPTPPDMNDHGLPTDGYFPSSWTTSHPARPPSGMMLTSDPSQYIHPSSHPDEMHYASSTTLAGLPGAAHHDLLQPQTQMPTSGGGSGGQLDPQLLHFNPDGETQVYGNSQYSMWQQESSGNVYLPYNTSLEPSPIPYASASSLQPGVRALDSSLDPAGGEFDHWINHPQGY
ncbi:hypothetical protein BJX76DRAFT_30368 [Aspergillus varians]